MKNIKTLKSLINAFDNGQVMFKIEKLINANKRGLLLLDLEGNIEKKIDKGVTFGCEPVGDKSVLRKLRGVTIDSKLKLWEVIIL